MASLKVDLGWSRTRHGSRAVWVTWWIGGCLTSCTISGGVTEAGEWWSEFQIVWIMNHKSWCSTLYIIAVLYLTWLLLLFRLILTLILYHSFYIIMVLFLILWNDEWDAFVTKDTQPRIQRHSLVCLVSSNILGNLCQFQWFYRDDYHSGFCSVIQSTNGFGVEHVDFKRTIIQYDSRPTVGLPIDSTWDSTGIPIPFPSISPLMSSPPRN